MEKWINEASLALLNEELAAHSRTLPLLKKDLDPYLETQRELLDRVRLHVEVLGMPSKKLQIRRS